MSNVDDFFSAVNQPSANQQRGGDNVRTFADAINHRFNNPAPSSASLPPSLLTARLLPSSSSATSAMPPSSSPHTAPSAHTFTPWLDNPTTLVVDIRPHAAYANARLPRALSLSVPSTLLKRPMFSLDKLAAMLPASTARSRFTRWHTAARIIVYDTDSAAIPDHSNIHGLLRKFRNDPVHFTGELAWVQGGFQAVWREQPHLIDNNPPPPETDAEEDDQQQPLLRARLPASAFSAASTTAAMSPQRPQPRSTLSARLRASGIPSLSLSQPQPARAHPNSSLSLSFPFNNPTPQPSATISNPPTTLPAQPAYNPFFDTIRQNVELSHGITERIPLRLPRRIRQRIHELPFRWLQDIARKAEARTPPGLSARSARTVTDVFPSSGSDSDVEFPSPRLPLLSPAADPDPADVDEGTEALAMQFYRIELAEQRRLMGVMEHHSKESETTVGEHADKGKRSEIHHEVEVDENLRERAVTLGHDSLSSIHEPKLDGDFPFSITAGVEKGAKNSGPFLLPRIPFTPNIPVVSPAPSSDADAESEYDDYVNASYVQPLGTTKQYIATQGPLPATYKDFWTLVWEQNVHVIVMLTRRIEGGMIKCGAYWAEERFGPLRLKLISESGKEGGEVDPSSTPSNPFDAAAASVAGPSSSPIGTNRPKSPKQSTIRREFELRHTKYPRAGTRRIIQLQFLEWPDMNVPDDPRDVLSLIWEVENAVEETKRDRLQREEELLEKKRHEKKATRAEVIAKLKSGGGASKSISSDQQSLGTLSSSSSDDDVDEWTGIVKHAKGERVPVLLHCSAGVGRTGGFIAVDAILDGIRREMRKRVYGSLSSGVIGNVMGTSSGDASASALSGSASGSRRTRGTPESESAGGERGASTGASAGGSGSRSGRSGSGSGNVADGSAGYEDKMDVDGSPSEATGIHNNSSEAIVDVDASGMKMGGTVPITMTAGDDDEISGETSYGHDAPGARELKKAKKVRGKGNLVEAGRGLVVHVPYVVGGDRDLLKTPMQMSMEVDEDDVDDDDLMVSMSGHDRSSSHDPSRGEEQKASTRKWAETVLDETSAAMDAGDAMVLDDGSNSLSQSASPPNIAAADVRLLKVGGESPEGAVARSFGAGVFTSGSSSSEDSFGFGHRGHRHQSSSRSHRYGSEVGSGTSTSLATSHSSSPGKDHGADKRSTRIGGSSSPGSGELAASKLAPSASPSSPGSDRVGGRVADTTDPIPKKEIANTASGANTAKLMGQASNSHTMGAIGGAWASGVKPAGNSAAGIGPSPLGAPAAIAVAIPHSSKGKGTLEGESGRNVPGSRIRVGLLAADAPKSVPWPSEESRSAPAMTLPPKFGHPIRSGGIDAGFSGGNPALMTVRGVRATSVLSSEEERPPSRSLSLSPSASGTSDAQYGSVASRLGRVLDVDGSSVYSMYGGMGASVASGDNVWVGDERRGRIGERGADMKAIQPFRLKDDSVSDSRPESTSPPGSRSRSTPPSLSASAGKASARATTVDYKEPRPLHGKFSPTALSSFEDPICEVVQDMREQRMSLCQSLRQYVFVHAAIIEGALMIVDEERERAKGIMAERSSRSGSGSGTGSGSISPNEESGNGKAMSVLPPVPVTPVRQTTAHLPSMISSPSTGKRGASPTELLKEDKKGGISLSKRPSIKRKQTGSDGNTS
ncbi:hypothetical protein PLEOSDRAFT_1095875 [Pleurotus ostreatus PC15]|uniref:protein-tyrosine-phosphatase n=1 Tax=Pleurotus ostreatus (strain PC15) TaxID=1137138 RepID=A0A067NQN4_PLEO1|nr:hypothetical protein PLEOSDRAFT_1095875 [Pleurotus ostreatus PC15]